jgi:hypothetical protein
MVNSRKKGADFEYRICKKLKELTGREWVRSPASGGVATKTGNNALAGDVLMRNGKCKYVFELKKYKEIRLEEILKGTGNLPKWIKQLEREKGDRPGILVWSENYGKIYVMVETNMYIPNTFKYNGYVIGIWENVMPIIMMEYIK